MILEKLTKEELRDIYFDETNNLPFIDDNCTLPTSSYLKWLEESLCNHDVISLIKDQQ